MKKDLKEIIDHFGLDHQIKHWFTEVYELVQAIERDDGSLTSKHNIMSELADNYNFLGQFKEYFDIDDAEIKAERHYKNKRTLDNIYKK